MNWFSRHPSWHFHHYAPWEMESYSDSFQGRHCTVCGRLQRRFAGS